MAISTLAVRLARPAIGRDHCAQDPKKEEQKPDVNDPQAVVTDAAVRVQPMDPDEKGHWIVMAGYNELGSPCFSRDGRWVAFDAYKEGYNNGRPEAWIARSDGTGLKKLTNGATPRWSPDGKRLLLIRGSEVEANGEPDIYLIKPDGTDERKLSHGRWPDWSPDGKKIAFSRGGLPGGGAKFGAAVSISNADGSDEKYIAEGDCPSWSPDGKKIACCFREEEAPPRIRVVELETGEAKTIGNGWFRANWMPDGKALVANGFFGRRGNGEALGRRACWGSRTFVHGIPRRCLAVPVVGRAIPRLRRPASEKGWWSVRDLQNASLRTNSPDGAY